MTGRPAVYPGAVPVIEILQSELKHSLGNGNGNRAMPATGDVGVCERYITTTATYHVTTGVDGHDQSAIGSADHADLGDSGASAGPASRRRTTEAEPRSVCDPAGHQPNRWIEPEVGHPQIRRAADLWTAGEIREFIALIAKTRERQGEISYRVRRLRINDTIYLIVHRS